ncbi:MAG: hypothetical protein WBG92_01645 [Thiohalocapsa sp.]
MNVFRKGDQERFFANLSDFGQADPVWEGDRLNPRARLRSFEIIFVDTQSAGSLSIHAPGNTKYVDDLAQYSPKPSSSSANWTRLRKTIRSTS